MARHDKILNRLAGKLDLSSQPLPGVPIIEIGGDRRVLIENHRGVTEYGKERICIQVKYGKVIVSGVNLELGFMSKQQLIVCGRIDSVTLERGDAR